MKLTSQQTQHSAGQSVWLLWAGSRFVPHLCSHPPVRTRTGCKQGCCQHTDVTIRLPLVTLSVVQRVVQTVELACSTACSEVDYFGLPRVCKDSYSQHNPLPSQWKLGGSLVMPAREVWWLCPSSQPISESSSTGCNSLCRKGSPCSEKSILWGEIVILYFLGILSSKSRK